MKRLLKCLAGFREDSRGSELVETVAKIAFIVLPLLVALIMVATWSAGDVGEGKTQANEKESTLRDTVESIEE